MSNKILVVDDKQMMRDSVGKTLQRAGYGVIAAANGQHALDQVAKHQPTAVITDLKMPEMDGLQLLGQLKAADLDLPVILMTAYGSVNDAVEAMKVGAFDFIQKPFESKQLEMVLRRALDHRRLNRQNAAKGSRASTKATHDPSTNQASDDQPHAPNLVGQSAAMDQLSDHIRRIAESQAAVLIQGESGTGKEVAARSIHANSPRRDNTMLCLNCAALSSSLLESELFGHEKGAFTGADQLRKGRFELADGGTLLLDEISEIPPELQAKLLRVLQEGQFERVGSSQSIDVDVRVIATTNRDLSQAVRDGSFRQDLFYRLNVLPIELPPLRERAEDVSTLAQHFLEQIARRDNREPKQLRDAAREKLKRYDWPGNVRELQNICERADVLCPSQIIEAGLIEPWLISSPSISAPLDPAPSPAIEEHAQHTTNPSITVRPLVEIEREQVIRALEHYKGNRVRSAQALGIGVRTLGLKLKKWKQQNVVAQTL